MWMMVLAIALVICAFTVPFLSLDRKPFYIIEGTNIVLSASLCIYVAAILM